MREDTECPICLDRDVNVSLTCGHFLCKQCAMKCMLKKSFCPICDQPVYRIHGDLDESSIFIHPHGEYGFHLRSSQGTTYVDNLEPNGTAKSEGLLIGDIVLGFADCYSTQAEDLAKHMETARSAKRGIFVAVKRRTQIVTKLLGLPVCFVSTGGFRALCSLDIIKAGDVILAIDECPSTQEHLEDVGAWVAPLWLSCVVRRLRVLFWRPAGSGRRHLVTLRRGQ